MRLSTGLDPDWSGRWMCSHRAGELGVGADDVLAHVLGVRTGVADALDAGHGIDLAQQLGEGDARVAREVAAVGVDVLAQQRHLAHPVVGEPADLLHQFAGRPAHLAPARGGHDAVGADRVAADADLHPALEVAGALGRQVAGETLELEEALGGERVRGEELGQLMDLTGAEGDVDEGEAREHLLLDRLRPAPSHSDHRVGMPALERLGLPQMGHEAAVGGLADRAGVEEDEIGVGTAPGLGVAQ